jgi:hypothetical protein
MTGQPSMPGGYLSGAEALRGLVQTTQLLSAAEDCKARLTAALESIDRMISRTNGARQDALRAVERFAEEQPSSLGVITSPQLAAGVADIEGRLSVIERDVREVLDKAGDLP